MNAPASIRTELAAAFRAVNAAYHRLPVAQRPDVSWSALDDVLERALGENDRDKALAVIREWRTHWLSLFEDVAR
jgi:hypothetical protein